MSDNGQSLCPTRVYATRTYFYALQGDHVLGLSFAGGGFADECVLDAKVTSVSFKLLFNTQQPL